MCLGAGVLTGEGNQYSCSGPQGLGGLKLSPPMLS